MDEELEQLVADIQRYDPTLTSILGSLGEVVFGSVPGLEIPECDPVIETLCYSPG